MSVTLSHRLGFLLVSLCPLASMAANGPAAPFSTEQEFFGDLPVVLSVSRLAQPVSEAPGSVTVIDSETIRLSGAREVADIFRLVPGFQVGTTGATSRLYYHGALEQFGQHMQVLIDGRSVYSPFYAGGINWNNVPLALDDIERIEAVRGSNSAAYGANSFLGVLNIITKHPSQTRGWTFTQTNGGQAVNDTLLRYGASTEQGDYRLSVGHRADQSSETSYSARDVRHFNFRGDWRSGLADEFQLQIGGTDTTEGVGRPDITGDQPRDRYSASDFVLARWQRNLASEDELRLTYYHTDERSRDNFPFPNPGLPGFDLTIDFGGTASRDSLEAQHTFSPARDMRLVWGGELRRDSTKSMALYATNASLNMELVRLFANLEWRLVPNLVLNAGASVDKSSLSGTELSPRLALNYHLTPDQTLRAGISKATRAPSIFEKKADLAYYLQGMPILETYRALGNLQSEEIFSRELGYVGNFRSIGLTVDARLYEEHLINLVGKVGYNNPITALPPILASLPFGFQQLLLSTYKAGPYNFPSDSVNSGHIHIRGLEYQLKYRPWAGTQLMLNQSFIRTSDQAPLQFPDRKVAPSHATSIALFQKLPFDADLSIILNNVGAMFWPGSGVPAVTPAYQRVDIRLAYPFNLGPSRAELAVTAQNLGGEHVESDAYYLVSRRIFTSLNLHF